ncbi:MAG: U32 family peptidase [Muribaculaceae bacterium]
MNTQNMCPRKIELLAPAKDASIAIEAINHGADAVYIGAGRFGARSAAGNSVEDIALVVNYAHQFNARVYVTLNTILKDEELNDAQTLIKELYDIKVDALIIQDLGILRMDIPPIPIHASTQCDISTIEKAQFLEKLGFSQLILARELSLNEINSIHKSVNVPIEAFVHGALCVSYSGRCHVSQVAKNRSANRGECAQICRLPYDLIDGNGTMLKYNKHLLSLRDLNQSDRLEEMLDAGVTSLKIEGRLKEIGYVKNVVASYRKKLDAIIDANPHKYQRSSAGTVEIGFEPQLNRSFNRNFTHYFLDGKDNISDEMASFDTPKSLGEPIGKVKYARGTKIAVTTDETLSNGDGISFFNENKEYEGFRLNRVEDNVISTLLPINIAPKTMLYRTYNKNFDDLLLANSAKRYISITLRLEQKNEDIYLSANDELGNNISRMIDVKLSKANNSQKEAQHRVLSKLGNTIYKVAEIKTLDNIFIPSSILTELRRSVINEIHELSISNYHLQSRKAEDKNATSYCTKLTYADNIANDLARKLYIEHGVDENNIQQALEISPVSLLTGDEVLMTTRYCIRRELGCCKKTDTGINITEPLTLKGRDVRLSVEFDCANCQMLLRKLK